MNLRGTAFLLVAAVWGACAKSSEPPSALMGTFRSRVPVTDRARMPALYSQYQFSKEGVVICSLVEKSGAHSGRSNSKLRFSFTGRAIEVSPFEPLGADALFCAPKLTFVNEDRLLVDGSDAVLVRVQE